MSRIINTELIRKLSKQKQQFIEGYKAVIKAIRTDSIDELIRFMASFDVHLNIQQTNESHQNYNYTPNPIVCNVREIAKIKGPCKNLQISTKLLNKTSNNNLETSAAGGICGHVQRKCRKCGELGHYQKNCIDFINKEANMLIYNYVLYQALWFLHRSIYTIKR